MKKNQKILIIIAAAVFIAISFYSCSVGKYNNLITMEEAVSSQWAQVESQYQRRYDLIPNLVATVKGYAKHESEVFTEIAEARSKAGGVFTLDESIINDEQKLKEFQAAQNSLGGALSRLLSITENYPELKANQNFLALQDEIEGTENRISTERKRYNDMAKAFNTEIRKFPGSLIANSFGFEKKSYFTAASEAQTAPKIEF